MILFGEHFSISRAVFCSTVFGYIAWKYFLIFFEKNIPPIFHTLPYTKIISMPTPRIGFSIWKKCSTRCFWVSTFSWDQLWLDQSVWITYIIFLTSWDFLHDLGHISYVILCPLPSFFGRVSVFKKKTNRPEEGWKSGIFYVRPDDCWYRFRTSYLFINEIMNQPKIVPYPTRKSWFWA